MKKILLFASLLAVALVACGKKEEALPTPVTQTPAADTAAPAADVKPDEAPAAEAPAADTAAPATDAKPDEAATPATGAKPDAGV